MASAPFKSKYPFSSRVLGLDYQAFGVDFLNDDRYASGAASNSTPFMAKSPFYARVNGLGYESFPVDYINPPYRFNQGVLEVGPTDNWSVAGGCGGTYIPFSQVIYTITNLGRNQLQWAFSQTSTFLTCTPSSGTLGNGASTTIIVSLNAEGLLHGIYTCQFSINNTSTGKGGWTFNVTLNQGYPYATKDDFESYAIDDHYTTLAGGHCWNADGFFTLTPGYYVFDDYEGYPVGTIAIMYKGSAWSGPGIFASRNYLQVWDDFEAYALANLPTANKGSGWSGNGTFSGSIQYPWCYDTFESYIIGAITRLTFTASNTNWAADGTFAHSP